jgi:hypothetical protein
VNRSIMLSSLIGGGLLFAYFGVKALLIARYLWSQDLAASPGLLLYPAIGLFGGGVIGGLIGWYYESRRKTA